MKIQKFRAWDEDGHMFEPTKIEFNKMSEGDTWVWNNEIFGQLGSAVIDLMPSLNLKDGEGNELYEGDIVQFSSGSGTRVLVGCIMYLSSAYLLVEAFHNRFYKITMENDKGGLVDEDDEEIDSNKLFIIGNKYENKDLYKLLWDNN